MTPIKGYPVPTPVSTSPTSRIKFVDSTSTNLASGAPARCAAASGSPALIDNEILQAVTSWFIDGIIPVLGTALSYN